MAIPGRKDLFDLPNVLNCSNNYLEFPMWISTNAKRDLKGDMIFIRSGRKCKMTILNEIQDVNLRNSEDLCSLVEKLGYKETGRFVINQLQLKNGSYASSLLNFFDDNPDAMEVVKNWIIDNSNLEYNVEESDLEENDENL